MLNVQQQAVIDHIKSNVEFAPIRILAGPGSGKTHLLASTIGMMVNELNVDPSSMLIMTLTKNASEEMLQRIQRHVPIMPDQNVSTIHAYTFRALKEQGDKRQVAKVWQEKQFLNDIIGNLWVGESVAWKDLLHCINVSKSAGYSAYQAESIWQAFGWAHSTISKLTQSRILFDKACREKKVLTFADMLYDFEVMLRTNPNILKLHQDRFKYVFLDEAQDVGGQTYRIALTVAEPHNHIFMVGDLDQLLYRFAGANPEYMSEKFDKRYPDGTTFKLEVNYRSTKTIVEKQQLLVAPHYGDHNRHMQKKLVARDDADQGEPIVYRHYDTVKEEAQGIAEEILALQTVGYTYASHYVLTRTRAYLGYIESVLVAHRIPFVNIRGTSFWESGFVGMLLSYLSIILDRNDDDAFRSIYNVASRYMTQPFNSANLVKGESQISHRYLGESFVQACTVKGMSLWQGMMNRAYSHRDSWRWQAGMDDFIGIVDQLTPIEDTTTTDLLNNILDEIIRPYIMLAEGSMLDPEGSIEDDFSVVLDIASEYPNPQDFRTYIRNLLAEIAKAKAGKGGDVVVLSTVHGVKGNERDVVFCAGWMEKILPIRYAIDDTANGASGLLSIPYTPTQDNLNDEACIAYVAVSRAQDRVYISSCASYQNKPYTPSRYIKRLGLTQQEESMEV